ncbi:MAG TPA: sugar ABC transporter permease [Kiloniellales bacterium]
MMTGGWSAKAVRRTVEGYLYLLPVFLILGLVVALPLFETLRLSFHEVYLLKGLGKETFIGLQNYFKFFQHPNASVFALNTLIYVSGGVTGTFLAGLGLALLLSQRLFLRSFWRGLALVPWAMPITVTAMIWKWVLDGQWGILNYVLSRLGLVDNYVSWLSSGTWLWPAILAVDVWALTPFMFVNFLSALQSIPRELYEAARIDGAGPWITFWRITLPMLRPVIMTVLLISVILHLREFAIIWILTSGGPGVSSTTLSPLVYIESFRYFRMGYGAAIGIILMSGSLLFTWFYLRRLRVEPY